MLHHHLRGRHVASGLLYYLSVILLFMNDNLVLYNTTKPNTTIYFSVVLPDTNS